MGTAPDPTRPAVRAAGGAVMRPGSVGPEVLLVHRPRYDDWTLPKGKAQEGESDEETALREVEEETGLRCRLEEDLGSIAYLDRFGRLKTVHYWSMTPLGGSSPAGDEVDRSEWLPLEDAAARLSYPRDRELLESMQRTTRRSPGI